MAERYIQINVAMGKKPNTSVKCKIRCYRKEWLGFVGFCSMLLITNERLKNEKQKIIGTRCI